MNQPYRLARGVRLQRDADGTALLLVPEGIVTLNETAAAVVELLDGERRVDAIERSLVERYEVSSAEAAEAIRELLDDFSRRGFVAS